jgi:hypothetical protein
LRLLGRAAIDGAARVGSYRQAVLVSSTKKLGTAVGGRRARWRDTREQWRSRVCLLRDHKCKEARVMMPKAFASVAAAAGLLTMAALPMAHAQYAAENQVITNGPQSSGVERSGGWSAEQNVRESERYHRLLEQNRRFREARMRTECGPITDPQLHQQCIDSFAQFSPSGGHTPAYATLGNGSANYGATGGANYSSAAGTNQPIGTGNTGAMNGGAYGATGTATYSSGSGGTYGTMGAGSTAATGTGNWGTAGTSNPAR